MTAGNPTPKGRPWLKWAGGAIAALLVLGAIGSVLGNDEPEVGAASPTADESEDPTEQPTDQPTQRPTQRPTERPESTLEPDGPRRASVGESVSITCGGDPCLEVRVSRPSFHDFYQGQYFNDEPQQSGWQFLQVYVKYRSLEDGSTYNQFDWAIYANGRQLESFAFASEGPEPELSSGTLPKGRSAEGWLLYEVPPRGQVVLSYEPNFDGPPVFEVVLRRQ